MLYWWTYTTGRRKKEDDKPFGRFAVLFFLPSCCVSSICYCYGHGLIEALRPLRMTIATNNEYVILTKLESYKQHSWSFLFSAEIRVNYTSVNQVTRLDTLSILYGEQSEPQENAPARGGDSFLFVCYSRVTSRDSPKWRAYSGAFFEVVRETGSVSCRIALWDCFGDAIAAFIVITRLRRRLDREFLSPKTAPWCNSTQHRSSPTRTLMCSTARTRIIWRYGKEETMNETAIFLVLIGNPFRYEPLCYTKSYS